jgi:hypothetical protein
MAVLVTKDDAGIGINIVDRRIVKAPDPVIERDPVLRDNQKIICMVKMGLPEKPTTFALTFDMNGESKLGFTRIQKDDLSDSRNVTELGDAKVLDLTSPDSRIIMPGLFDQGIDIEMVDSDELSLEPPKAFIKIYGSVDLDGVTEAVNTKMSLENFLTLFNETNFNKTLVRIQKGEKIFYALRIPTEERRNGIGLDMLLLLTDKPSLEKSLHGINTRGDSEITKDILTEVMSKLRERNPLLNAQIQAQLTLAEIPKDKKLFRTLEELKLWGKYMYSKEGEYYDKLSKIKSGSRRLLVHFLRGKRGRIKYEASDLRKIHQTQEINLVALFAPEPTKLKELEKPKEPEGFIVNTSLLWALDLMGPNARVLGINSFFSNANILVGHKNSLSVYNLNLGNPVDENGVTPNLTLKAPKSMEGAFLVTSNKDVVTWSKSVLEVTDNLGNKNSLSLAEINKLLPDELDRGIEGDEIVAVFYNIATNSVHLPVPPDSIRTAPKQVISYGIFSVFTKSGREYRVGDYRNEDGFRDYDIYTRESKKISIKRDKVNPLVVVGVNVKTGVIPTPKELDNDLVMYRTPGKITLKGYRTESPKGHKTPYEIDYRNIPSDKVSVISHVLGLGEEENKYSSGEYVQHTTDKYNFLDRLVVGTVDGRLIAYRDVDQKGFDLANPIINKRLFPKAISDIVGINTGEPVAIISSAEIGEAIVYDTSTFREICRINIPIGSKVLQLVNLSSSQAITVKDPHSEKARAHKIPNSIGLLLETNGILSNHRLDIKYS